MNKTTAPSGLFAHLHSYLSELESDFGLSIKSGGHFALCNSGRRGDVKEFNFGVPEIIETIQDLKKHHDSFTPAARYEEKTWRDLGGQFFSNKTANSLITVQTKPVFTTLSKIIQWANDRNPRTYEDGTIELSLMALDIAIKKLQEIELECSPTHQQVRINLPNKQLNEHEPTKHLFRSLLTKPFVILTGGSGTGKTKLAEAVARYYSDAEGANVEVVAVGADWTDNRNVLGFVNHLREVECGGSTGGEGAVKRSVYQSTAVLDLLLRAGERPAMPHFLILDEMNLSHVERYFADFLSAMEQAGGVLHLHDEGDGECLPRFAGDAVGVPGRLDWPDNLFVIGTVNVDETTYMFSPKVLDRANVLEFKVKDTDIAAFLESPRGYPAVECAELGQAEAFLQMAHRARRNPDVEGGLEGLSGAAAEAVGRHLLSLFKILQRGRFEFAYRTANEVMRYLRVSRHLATDKAAWDADGWRTDVDAQILQKLLPKLHGSVGRIGPLLAELAAYCQSGTVTGEDRNRREHAALRLQEAESLSEADAVFPASLRKLKAMIRALNEEQFVSFIQ